MLCPGSIVKQAVCPFDGTYKGVHQCCVEAESRRELRCPLPPAAGCSPAMGRSQLVQAPKR